MENATAVCWVNAFRFPGFLIKPFLELYGECSWGFLDLPYESQWTMILGTSWANSIKVPSLLKTSCKIYLNLPERIPVSFLAEPQVETMENVIAAPWANPSTFPSHYKGKCSWGFMGKRFQASRLNIHQKSMGMLFEPLATVPLQLLLNLYWKAVGKAPGVSWVTSWKNNGKWFLSPYNPLLNHEIKVNGKRSWSFLG